MFSNPSIHLELARQRQRDLLARSERHRLAREARSGSQNDRGTLIERPALDERPPIRIACPQRAET